MRGRVCRRAAGEGHRCGSRPCVSCPEANPDLAQWEEPAPRRAPGAPRAWPWNCDTSLSASSVSASSALASSSRLQPGSSSRQVLARRWNAVDTLTALNSPDARCTMSRIASARARANCLARRTLPRRSRRATPPLHARIPRARSPRHALQSGVVPAAQAAQARARRTGPRRVNDALVELALQGRGGGERGRGAAAPAAVARAAAAPAARGHQRAVSAACPSPLRARAHAAVSAPPSLAAGGRRDRPAARGQPCAFAPSGPPAPRAVHGHKLATQPPPAAAPTPLQPSAHRRASGQHPRAPLPGALTAEERARVCRARLAPPPPPAWGSRRLGPPRTPQAAGPSGARKSLSRAPAARGRSHARREPHSRPAETSAGEPSNGIYDAPHLAISVAWSRRWLAAAAAAGLSGGRGVRVLKRQSPNMVCCGQSGVIHAAHSCASTCADANPDREQTAGPLARAVSHWHRLAAICARQHTAAAQRSHRPAERRRCKRAALLCRTEAALAPCCPPRP
jgi:hypothetical protein